MYSPAFTHSVSASPALLIAPVPVQLSANVLVLSSTTPVTCPQHTDPSSPADGLAEADGLMDGLTDLDGEREGDSESDTDGEIETETDELGLNEGETEMET